MFSKIIFLVSLLSISLFSQPINNEMQMHTETKPYYVGELGEKWEFPSDHLPVGGSIDNVHFALWNILNTAYLNHIIDNDQGLLNSLIMQANLPLNENSPLTIREELIIQNILQMLTHPKQLRALLALQETSALVFTELKSHLPKNIHLYPDDVSAIGHGDVYLYDADQFELISADIEPYEVQPRNSIQLLVFKKIDSGELIQFIQSHVPGGPVKSEPARKQLAEYVMKHFNPEITTLIVGDMNRPSSDFIENFAAAAKELGRPNQPYKAFISPYATHINTHMEASWIDNIFIYTPKDGANITLSEDAADFFDSLQPILNLLESLKNSDNTTPHST